MTEEIIIAYNKRLKNNLGLKNYEKPGVWALWGKDSEHKRVCLEVAQTQNIKSEIVSAIYVLSTNDDFKCIDCISTYPANRRYDYSAKFDIHTCKPCQYNSELRTKTFKRNPRYIDKYKDIISKYQNLEFVIIDISPEMKDKKRRLCKEKEYAENNRALYWWG